ncbi:GPI-anchored adhesin-like protein [Parasponia andersonii]|uniref:GPI-anchored adhesin-like protein n=1 Tax=Parasponia andersonii TaxID=3476 RepID=A0A2P5BSJ0_PARAD|nr:GPI-anchored adhesin-like protein [Parasponia andersonii]
MAATCSPSSLQLRFALNSGNSSKPSPLLVRAQLSKNQHRWGWARLVWNGAGPERRRHGVSSIRSDLSVDGFSGWSGTDGGEGSVDSERRKWFGGAVGAGAAGIVLVAGLTFSALSLGKRSVSRPKHMEPLTIQQEESLLSDEKIDGVMGDESENDSIQQDASSPEGGTGTYKDSSSSSEIVDVPSENRVVIDDSVIRDLSVDNAKYTSDGIDAINNVSIQDDSQHESTSNDKSVEADTVPNSSSLFESEIGNDSSVASGFKDLDSNSNVGTEEFISELKENPVNVGSTNLSISDDVPSNFSLDQDTTPGSSRDQTSDHSSIVSVPFEPVSPNVPVGSQSNTILEPHIASKSNIETLVSSSSNENFELKDTSHVLAEENSLTLEAHSISEGGSSGTSVSSSAYSLQNEQFTESRNEINRSTPETPKPGTSFSSAGIPAPSVVFSALQVLPGKVLVPAVVDQVQGQALAALQVLKVIEADVQPSDLCTRREYARWLVSASNALSRNTTSKVYPAMFIDNVTELAFDDITPEDPDFASIQGLAEAGLISSKLSRRDMLSSVDEDQEPYFFSPESPLSRQDLVSWKMALEKRHLPEADRKVLYQLSGFIDTDKIHPDACPAFVADLSAGEQGIIALSFGYTRLFQPDKPVTKAQAAIALATGEASDIVSEELARIEAESVAENVVSAHTALVAEVEKDINASFEKELLLEREKIDAVERMAVEATRELERLRAEREADNITLVKERAAIESEMEVLSRLRREVEEQLLSLLSNKVEIQYERERISKLRKEAEDESQEIERLQYELEVERKALSMARAWAEDEAQRAREQAKALEEARDRWERRGIKVVVDDDLREESLVGVTWVDSSSQFSVDGTVKRAENLMDKLKAMAVGVREKSRGTLNRILLKITLLISNLKEWAAKAGKRAEDLRDAAISRASGSAQQLQQSTSEFSSAIKESAKRVAGECREGVGKLTQKFKT